MISAPNDAFAPNSRCAACGAPIEPGAQFCGDCGRRAGGQAAVPPPPPAPVGAAPPANRSRWRRPWPWVALAAVVVIVAAVVLVIVLAGGDSADGRGRLATAIAPLGEANQTLSAELVEFEAGDDPATARRLATEAEDATVDAEVEVEGLDAGSDAAARAAVEDALGAQHLYLQALLLTIDDPSEATVSVLADAAEAVLEAWWAVDAVLPDARGRIGGFDNLAAWALPDGGAASPGTLPTADPAADIADYGSDDALDALAVGCEAGDLGACDDLYDTSPIDSAYEAYGDSCGGRNTPSDYCTQIYGD